MKRYDIAVIGGGIHGAGVAQAAAAAGYSVILLEQYEPAAGTSSKSSKLIHGGLRYLETKQFKLVYNAIKERSILLKNAPELVHPLKFNIPVYEDTTRPAWKIALGLTIYSLLNIGRGTDFSDFYVQNNISIPMFDHLRITGLKTIYQYLDAQTDDIELTKAVLKSAEDLGADIFFPATFRRGERIAQGTFALEYKIGSDIHECLAGTVVNATGPWVNQTLHKFAQSKSRLPIDLVKGTHIIVEHKLNHGAYYVESPIDKRPVFIIPWKDKYTLIGTTEVPYTGLPENCQPSDEEVDYLRQTANHFFPTMKLNNKLGVMAGLRVIPQTVSGEDNESAYFNKASRSTVIHHDPHIDGLVSIYGGKLTDYRLTAEKTVDSLKGLMHKRTRIADTATLPLKPVEQLS